MSKVARLFDDWARRGRAEGMESGHLQTAGPTLAAVPLRPAATLLDLGCGNAWASQYAKDHGARPLAIDLSPEMVRRASKRGIDAARADMAHLPLQDASIDHVWSMEAIYYAPDPDAVLREIARVLRPGGTVDLLLDHYQENVDSHSWPKDVGVPMTLRSQAQWLEALRTAGLHDIQAHRLRAAPGPGIDDWKVAQGTLHLQATGAPARNG